MCNFYVLYSQGLDTYYIGHTCDALEERIRKHNTSHKGYTGKTKDWRLVYYERFSDKKAAYARERAVKNWKNRKKIIALIAGACYNKNQVKSVKI
jgi:putative endonuclease